MEQSQRQNSDSGGDAENSAETLPGRVSHATQVTPVRHQATVQTKDKVRLATWNVNTLYQAGKYENLKKEMKRLNIDILGISEVRWTGSGTCENFVYSGGETHTKGVGVMMTEKVAKCVHYKATAAPL